MTLQNQSLLSILLSREVESTRYYCTQVRRPDSTVVVSTKLICDYSK